MRCAEASLILRPLQDEFALRYYEWSLEQVGRELEDDFSHIREVKSSLVFLFLEFVEGHSRAEVRDLMTGGIKRFQQRGAELRGERLTEKEQTIHRQFVDFFSEEIVIQGKPMTSFRVSRRERKLRDQELAGTLKFHQNKKSLREELKRKFQSAGFKAESEFTAGLNYCEQLGDWYLMTALDVSGKSQLDSNHRVAARRTMDTCFTDLLAGANLLSWCGIHPNTRYDLLREDELDNVAESILVVYRLFQQSLPDLLSGLHHLIPETLEDANPLAFQKHL
jgi:hypothetical protein